MMKAKGSTPLRVLIVEHEEADAELAVEELRRAGFDVHARVVGTAPDFATALAEQCYDVVLSAYRLRGWTGMHALAMLREMGKDIPLIFVSATIGDERAVECVKQGVADYITKDNLARLPVAVRRVVEERHLRGERREAIDALRASEERYRLIFDSMPLPVWLFDAGSRRVLAVNEAAVRHYGYTRDEFLALRIDDLRPAEDVPRLREYARAQAGTSGLRAAGVWRHRKKDGTLIWAEVSSHRLTWNGRPAELVAVNDITDRQRNEQALLESEERFRQAQKMEAVGRLAGGVAHDFNNVLTVITSYTDMLLGDLPPLDPMREDLQQIRQAADAATNLTRQLLAFSRRQVVEPRLVSIDSVVCNTEKLLKRLIGEDIELVTALSEQHSVVKVDPGQLEQVIVNLAVNARDAMPAGGTLTIETSRVEIDEAFAASHWPMKPGRFAMLAMNDTGVGMDEETRARIFEPFFTTKEVGKGTGLGLPMVYGIVKQGGGFVWVYSEPGRGATFKIYLPLVEAGEETAPPLADTIAEPEFGSETVLLVEDDPLVRKLARDVLTRAGYSVLAAGRPEDAIAVSDEFPGPIHLLLTDVIMPGISGRQLAERLAASRPEMRVLYMSGYTDDSIAHHGVLEPGIGLLEKPFTTTTLLRRVRERLTAKEGMSVVSDDVGEG